MRAILRMRARDGALRRHESTIGKKEYVFVSRVRAEGALPGTAGVELAQKMLSGGQAGVPALRER